MYKFWFSLIYQFNSQVNKVLSFTMLEPTVASTDEVVKNYTRVFRIFLRPPKQGLKKINNALNYFIHTDIFIISSTSNNNGKKVFINVLKN